MTRLITSSGDTIIMAHSSSLSRRAAARCSTLAILALLGIAERSTAARAATITVGQTLTANRLGAFKSGGRQTFAFNLQRPESLDLRIPFAEAPFNGTQLNV